MSVNRALNFAGRSALVRAPVSVSFSPLYRSSAVSQAFHTQTVLRDDTTPSKPPTDSQPPAEVDGESASLETAEEGEEAAAKVPRGRASKDVRLKKSLSWLYQQDGWQYGQAKLGQTNYIGGRLPFPMNPAFIPRTPTSDGMRTALYEEWVADPEKATPRLLAARYRISIARVEAILKLKILEKRQVDNKVPLQTDLTRHMEGMMGVPAYKPNVPTLRGSTEPMVHPVPEVGAPFFRAIDEEASFTAKEAAEALNRDTSHRANLRPSNKPFAFIDKHEMLMAEKTRTDHTVLDKNPVLQNRRWEFMFTDINPKVATKDRKILVRKTDGTLREATLVERQDRIEALWPKVAEKMYTA
ncbi:hypothetical protein H4R33_006455 [Dimargaris cristalligena]|nr:hypothetical protein H4R33_006455 [Dimargaris cristalligena]